MLLIGKSFIKNTPLEKNENYSAQFGAEVYFKREDLQTARSFKIRGAANKIMSLTEQEREMGVVTCSAGNHAQGVAYACKTLGIRCFIFVPKCTPLQKISRIREIGDKDLTLNIVGDNFNECLTRATQFCEEMEMAFVHPFDDPKVIEGQASIGSEIISGMGSTPDYIVVPVGGGGLISGIIQILDGHRTKVIGVEPAGCRKMYNSLQQGKVTSFSSFDTFVDGASVGSPGVRTFEICRKGLGSIYGVTNEEVCYNMVKMYQDDGIVAEPAGALAVAGLRQLHEEHDLTGKTVVCIITGGNNDLLRYPEIIEKSLIYQGLIHYFIVDFAQTPGQLKEFVNYILVPGDDIIHFEYLKKNNRNHGPVRIGFQLEKKSNIDILKSNMDSRRFRYKEVRPGDLEYSFM